MNKELSHALKTPSSSAIHSWKYEPDPESGLISIADMAILYNADPIYWLGLGESVLIVVKLAEALNLGYHVPELPFHATAEELESMYPGLIYLKTDASGKQDIFVFPAIAAFFAYWLDPEFGLHFLLKQNRYEATHSVLSEEEFSVAKVFAQNQERGKADLVMC